MNNENNKPAHLCAAMQESDRETQMLAPSLRPDLHKAE
jgi:hypothetical protein